MKQSNNGTVELYLSPASKGLTRQLRDHGYVFNQGDARELHYQLLIQSLYDLSVGGLITIRDMKVIKKRMMRQIMNEIHKVNKV